MGTRLELHEVLCDILGSRNVYYQPPETVKLDYPCIIYGRVNNDTVFADNSPYRVLRRYFLTLIDKNPDSPFTARIEKLPTCISDRFFTAMNLNHFTYDLYF